MKRLNVPLGPKRIRQTSSPAPSASSLPAGSAGATELREPGKWRCHSRSQRFGRFSRKSHSRVARVVRVLFSQCSPHLAVSTRFGETDHRGRARRVPDAAAGRELPGLFASHCHRLVNPEARGATATQSGNCGLIGNDSSRCTITRGRKTNKQQQAACAAGGLSKGQKTKVAPSPQRSARDPISSAWPTFHYYDTPSLSPKPGNLRPSRTPRASKADNVIARRYFGAPGEGKVTEVSCVLGPSAALRPPGAGGEPDGAPDTR